MADAQAPGLPDALPDASVLAGLNPVVATVFLLTLLVGWVTIYYGPAIRDRIRGRSDDLPHPEPPPPAAPAAAVLDRAAAVTDRLIAHLEGQVRDRDADIERLLREVDRLRRERDEERRAHERTRAELERCRDNQWRRL